MREYIKLLKDNNVFDFDSNMIEVTEVLVNPKTKNFYVSLNIEKTFKLEEYLNFIKGNNSIFNNMKINEIIYNIKYKRYTLNENDIIEYFNYILDILKASSSFYVVFKDLKLEVNDKQIMVQIDKINDDILEYANNITKTFNEFHLDINVVPVESNNALTIDEMKEQNLKEAEKEIEVKQQIAKEISNKADIVVKSYNRKVKVENKSKIVDIPNSQESIFEFANKFGETIFMIEGEVFGSEIRKMKNSSLATIKVTDYSDSIVVKKWLRQEKEIELISKLGSGDIISVSGKAEYDMYAKNVVIMADSISYVGKKIVQDRTDDAEVKRVELHAHTKMSNLDGISEASEYIAEVKKWGHKAIAFTDHNGVYSIPDINKACKGSDIKPIYGIELPYIDDSKISITYGNSNKELRNASYVVFDIETTGFSQEHDRIIEIAAIKVRGGEIIDSYSTFVNPEILISQKITDITTITNDMVKDAPKIDQVMNEFLKFSEDSIFVAHNATFDVGHIYANMKRLGLEKIDFPVIDTLNLSRAMYADVLKRFNLKAIAKYFKIKQEQHHRAIDDTRVTVECFLCMLDDLYRQGVVTFSDINNVIKRDEIWKHIIPSHINILVKNQVGYKNLFKIVSDSLTNHLYDEARLLKSVLYENREGILLGSGCVHGQVFENALNRSEEELEESIMMFDYIEVQPPLAYSHLFSQVNNGVQVIYDTISKIIRKAKELGKIVVATSDCHYIRKDQKKYRDILIASPQIGGGQHDLARYENSPHMHLRTTNEMLEEFNFLDKDLAYEIVVTNTNIIADMIESVKCFHKQMFVPADDEFKDKLGVPSIIEEMKNIVNKNVIRFYGENPHNIVKKRIERELNSIISNGYSSVYFMSYLLVNKSLEDGYLVGSRGSVGSSLAATMMMITEINPLAPHYRCNKCKFTAFKMTEDEKKDNPITENELPFQKDLASVESGYDLPDAVCPVCGNKLTKDGHDIPFETFLGFNGDKVPDIDLNFSGEYQSIAHEYVRELLGNEYAFRGGTVATVAEKNAYGYVKAYIEKKGLDLRTAEIDRISEKIVGVKRSTGQHPGGIVVVPKSIDIYDVTPIQYPADNYENAWRTTHFDYHAFEDNLLKLDILGHDDPTMIRYLMDYVNKHQEAFPFDNPQDIPVDDSNVYRLFCGTEVINVDANRIDSKVASYAVPEFGTNFVRQMLTDTLPKTFAELVKISGLSHGTDVWLNNAQDLVLGKTSNGKIDFSEVIGCRDDIMVYLLYQNLEPIKAFEIMEFVRRGKPSKDTAKWEEYKEYMRKYSVPEWYIWSCEQIKYMFPKAHATAYVLMALRIAWFKVYSPVLFYSAYFSKRAKAFDVKTFVSGENAIRMKIRELTEKQGGTAKDEDTLTSLYVALEMTSRGYEFLPVDIEKSDSLIFEVEDGKLRIPFIAVDGLGEAVAIDIKERREERAFTSKKDIESRTRLNKTLFEQFEQMGSFGTLPDVEKEIAEGIFAFLD